MDSSDFLIFSLINVLCVFLLKLALPFLLWVLVTATWGVATALFRRFGRLFVLVLFLFAN